MGKLIHGGKFNEWSNAKQLNYLEELASSQNEALEAMQNERNALLVKVKEMVALLENAQEALSIQKEINRNTILKQNSDVQEAGIRIQELQAKLRAH